MSKKYSILEDLKCAYVSGSVTEKNVPEVSTPLKKRKLLRLIILIIKKKAKTHKKSCRLPSQQQQQQFMKLTVYRQRNKITIAITITWK